jgi:hypothetical protein
MSGMIYPLVEVVIDSPVRIDIWRSLLWNAVVLLIKSGRLITIIMGEWARMLFVKIQKAGLLTQRTQSTLSFHRIASDEDGK